MQWCTVLIDPDAEFPGVLAAAQAGDGGAVGRLYRAYNPALIRFFAGQAPAVKEDLAQEVWLSVAASLRTFQGDEGQFRAWLFTIARRRTIDHWRLVSRRSVEVTVEFLDLPQPEHPDQLVIEAAIAELTAGLSAEQSEIVLLRVVAGLSVEQVAGIVGKTAGAVRVMQHRALRRLADQISSRCVTP
jgi:RNA polymerase sigma-70 factor (ECF subfamily)